MGGGEKGTWQGEIYRDSAVQLVRFLQYEEIVAGDADFDFIGRCPAGPPATELCKPHLSPQGVVGFEFTSQGGVTEADIDDLLKKVQLTETQHKFGMTGGVLICDLRLPERTYRYAHSKGCYVWDLRDISLQVLKIYLCKTAYKYSMEIPLSDTVTFLWGLDEVARPGTSKASGAVLFQDPVAELTARDLDQTLQLLGKRVTEIKNQSGIRSLELSLTVYTRSYCTRDFYDNLDAQAGRLSAPGVLEIKSRGIVSFFVGPWSGMLTL